jgi:hypothetical protein
VKSVQQPHSQSIATVSSTPKRVVETHPPDRVMFHNSITHHAPLNDLRLYGSCRCQSLAHSGYCPLMRIYILRDRLLTQIPAFLKSRCDLMWRSVVDIALSVWICKEIVVLGRHNLSRAGTSHSRSARSQQQAHRPSTASPPSGSRVPRSTYLADNGLDDAARSSSDADIGRQIIKRTLIQCSRPYSEPPEKKGANLI